MHESPQEDDHNESPQEDDNDELQTVTNFRLLYAISKGEILLEDEIEMGKGSSVWSMLKNAKDTKMLVGCDDGHLRGFETIGLKKKVFDVKLHDDRINDLKLVQNEMIRDNREILITCSRDKSIKLYDFDSENAKCPISNEKAPLQTFKHSDCIKALLVFPEQ